MKRVEFKNRDITVVGNLFLPRISTRMDNIPLLSSAIPQAE